MIAASYDFGKFALKGNYITSQGHPAAPLTPSSTEMNIGATVPMGKVTLIAQVGSNKVTETGAATDLTGNDFVIGADYNLSAKTALFAKTGTWARSAAVRLTTRSSAPLLVSRPCSNLMLA